MQHKLLRKVLPGLALSLMLSPMVLPAQASYFDRDSNDGRNGSAGRAGRGGASPASQTYFTTGTTATIDLSGQAGDAGDDGQDGERPYCSYDRYHHRDDDLDRDIHEGDGGHGGSGGDGGRGGDGGNLTLYYTDVSDLRNLLVRVNGGRGGRGGRSGRGASGCRCPRRQWQVEKCSGSGPDRKCHHETYSCYDGSDGRDGSEGADGKEGYWGQVTLIPRSTQLPQDQRTQTASFAQWQQQQIELSHNRWTTGSSTSTLFAPGSVVPNIYTFLEERVERAIKLQWKASEPLSQFAEMPAKFTIDENKQVQITYPQDFWAKSTFEQSGNQATVTINEVMNRREALRLGVVGLRGSGSKLSLKLLDVALQTNRVSTGTVQIKYRIKQDDGSLQTYFEGEVPAQSVQARANEFVISLGQLGIEPAVLQAGTRLDLEVKVRRSFGQHSSDQVISWQGTIGAL